MQTMMSLFTISIVFTFFSCSILFVDGFSSVQQLCQKRSNSKHWKQNNNKSIQLPSYISTVLNAIDEAAVSSSVQIPQKQQEQPPKKSISKPTIPPPQLSKSTTTSSSIDPTVALAVGALGVFAIATFALRNGQSDDGATNEAMTTPTKKITSPPPAPTVKYDVSVPYDSAALLEYETWRSKHSKGPFDAKKFEVFKNNYYKVTVANVATKKLLREIPPLQELDETADEK